jgi:hypothetical protein
MKFRELIINESLNSTLKQIDAMASDIQELDFYKDIIKNVKTYMELSPASTLQYIEHSYNLIKGEIDDFLVKVNAIKKYMKSKVIDEIEETTQKLLKTLTHSYTHKTKRSI